MERNVEILQLEQGWSRHKARDFLDYLRVHDLPTAITRADCYKTGELHTLLKSCTFIEQVVKNSEKSRHTRLIIVVTSNQVVERYCFVLNVLKKPCVSIFKGFDQAPLTMHITMKPIIYKSYYMDGVYADASGQLMVLCPTSA